MAVMVRSRQKGIEDGSIRADIGDPLKVCFMLWAFTHGLIQIATTKAQEIARRGIEAGRFMEDGRAMLRQMLAPRA